MATTKQFFGGTKASYTVMALHDQNGITRGRLQPARRLRIEETRTFDTGDVPLLIGSHIDEVVGLAFGSPLVELIDREWLYLCGLIGVFDDEALSTLIVDEVDTEAVGTTGRRAVKHESQGVREHRKVGLGHVVYMRKAVVEPRIDR